MPKQLPSSGVQWGLRVIVSTKHCCKWKCLHRFLWAAVLVSGIVHLLLLSMLWNDSSPIWVLREPVFWRKPICQPEWDHLPRCLLLREPPGLLAQRILRLLLFLLLEYLAARTDLREQLHGLRVQWRLRLLLSGGLFPRGRWECLRLLMWLSDGMLVDLCI